MKFKSILSTVMALMLVFMGSGALAARAKKDAPANTKQLVAPSGATKAVGLNQESESNANRSVNPGEEPNMKKRNQQQEATASATGVENCPECIARLKANLRLGDKTNPSSKVLKNDSDNAADGTR